ncbi:MAG: polymerase sigma factor, sigma-70 family [Herbinix sp.]|jgi:RNA polymerase sigma-70 factor (ECF subfamily)|nr:polymerase sigma factor, sigma-70 family [Herbinix sp.]
MDQRIEDQLNILTQEYLSSFLAFCLKRTSNIKEAEEVAQEIAYQCVKSIYSGKKINNLNTYLWSIAHNTYKRWLNRKKGEVFRENIDLLGEIIPSDSDLTTEIIKLDEMREVRHTIALLSHYYRDVLVSFYFDELTIGQIAMKYNLTEEMVKYYLQKGRVKFKEAYTMSLEYGEKSYKASDFSIFYSGIDFSYVNVWQLFKRKLPAQIALICYDAPKTISEIALETGTPSIYLEDEIKLLIEGGVMISPVKNKYRTNFYIMRKNSRKQLEEQFEKMHQSYIPKVIDKFLAYLPELKRTKMFKHPVKDERYAWMVFQFVNPIPMDDHKLRIDDNDYPVILSCGARAFIFAEETTIPEWAGGTSPTKLEDVIVYPTDIGVFGKYRHQDNLRSKEKCQALYDIYMGNTKEGDKELYASLIKEGYAIKQDGSLYCELAMIDVEVRNIFQKINNELLREAQDEGNAIYQNICRMIKNTIPDHLNEYANGYAKTETLNYAQVLFGKGLYEKGMISIPEEGDLTPVACYLSIK